MADKITEPGIFIGFDIEAYFADPTPTPSLTQSIAKVLIERSAAHARIEHPRLAPPPTAEEPAEKYDAAKAIGNAAHAIMIGRGKLIAEAQFDNWMTKDAKAFRADAEEAGKLAILSKHLTRAQDMVKAASFQLEAVGWREAFRLGQGEVVIAWREGDLWFRSLIDWMQDTTLLYDFKTTGLSCAPHAIAAMIERAGWHVQAAMHERGLDELDPANAGRRKFRFIAQENEPPYALAAVELTEHWLTMGRKMLDHAIGIWSHCITHNVWPGYPPEVIRPEFPGYAETRWLAREIESDDGSKRAPRGSEFIMAG
jgi:hypothetical protein